MRDGKTNVVRANTKIQAQPRPDISPKKMYLGDHRTADLCDSFNLMPSVEKDF